MSPHPPFKQVEATRPPFDATFEPTLTKGPNPDFAPGQGSNSLPYAKDFEHSGWKTIDPADHEKAAVYKFMISSITPRPIAFVSTLSADGEANLAPMSYFNMVGHNPPAIMVSIQASTKNSDGLKDTNSNIKSTKEFCVSIISEHFVEAANYTSIDAPLGVDEWRLSGLTQRASETVKPAHVAESAMSMECKLLHWYDLTTDSGDVSNTVIIGRVQRFHVKDVVLDAEDGMKVDIEKLKPVARLGGITYARSNQVFELPRPKWDEVKDTSEVEQALSKDIKRV